MFVFLVALVLPETSQFPLRVFPLLAALLLTGAKPTRRPESRLWEGSQRR